MEEEKKQEEDKAIKRRRLRNETSVKKDSSNRHQPNSDLSSVLAPNVYGTIADSPSLSPRTNSRNNTDIMIQSSNLRRSQRSSQKSFGQKRGVPVRQSQSVLQKTPAPMQDLPPLRKGNGQPLEA